MKIPLDVRLHSEGLKPFVNIHLKIPHQTVRGSTVRGLFSAFVDTGSPFTLISEMDSNRLRIQLSGKPMLIRIGGSLLNKYDVTGVELKAICDDKKIICNISIPSIGVIRSVPGVSRSPETSRAMPSIIGVDILKQHRLALYFDVVNKISFLEQV